MTRISLAQVKCLARMVARDAREPIPWQECLCARQSFSTLSALKKRGLVRVWYNRDLRTGQISSAAHFTVTAKGRRELASEYHRLKCG